MVAIKYRNPANPTQFLYIGTVGAAGADGPAGADGAPGPQGAPVVELTQAAYDTLTPKDPDTLYVITDGADRTVLSGTSAPVAGQGIAGDYYINYATWTIYGPKTTVWPAGVSIIGADGEVAVVELTQAAYDALTPKDPATLYVITGGADRGLPSGGTAGQVLTKDTTTNYDVSWQTGGGGGITGEDAVDAVAAAFAAGTHTNVTVTYNDAANSISLAGSAGGGSTDIVELTQAAYDALTPKDPDTLYVITDGADRTVLTGTTAATAGVGINGDFYINTTAWTISGPKAAGAWPTPVSIIGPAGAGAGPNVTDLETKWAAASAAGPATLRLSEDTDFGTNAIVLSAPATNLAADFTSTFPGANGIVTLVGHTQTLTNKTIDLTSNTLTTTVAQLNTAVTDGDLIVAGNGATTLWKGTQAQYDAIVSKDANTVYVVS